MFTPIARNVTPFCLTDDKARRAKHAIHPGEKCAECGADNLTNETSDHMTIKETPGLVVLCLKCSDSYHEWWHLDRLVNP